MGVYQVAWVCTNEPVAVSLPIGDQDTHLSWDMFWPHSMVLLADKTLSDEQALHAELKTYVCTHWINGRREVSTLTLIATCSPH